MTIGILKEIKDKENRVAMTPSGVETLCFHGHEVLVEKGAGEKSGFNDETYEKSGASIIKSNKEIYEKSDMVMHVKEPQPIEYELIKENQIIFAYLHLAADEELTKALINTGCTAIAYETIQKNDGSLPLLTPMSEIAGRLSIQEGAKYLEMTYKGEGILLGGVPGVNPGTVLILGGGIVGINAAKMACGLGAKVFIFDNNLERLRFLSNVMPPNCFTIANNPEILRKFLSEADLIIGAVLLPGAKAPKIITKKLLKTMKKGAVIVDVSIDQGGCFETSKPTTHSDPIYLVDGVVHYCVTNMPGAVAKTSTAALTNATLPYTIELADKGVSQAIKTNKEIRLGVNVIQKKVTCKGVAQAFQLPYTDIESLLQ